MRSASMLFFALCTTIALSAQAFDQADYPKGPELSTTPGSLCEHPDQYRYPEHIPYCTRDVDTQLKRQIIRDYDKDFGYHIGSMDRQQFKIDHYIPLCAGGSNQVTNLWPQHQSVFNITDPLEQYACEKMAEGKLTQAKAIELIKKGKANLDQVEDIVRQIRAL